MLIKGSQRAYFCLIFVGHLWTLRCRLWVICGLLWIVTEWYIPIIVIFLCYFCWRLLLVLE